MIFGQFAISTAEREVSGLVQEFVLRKLTPAPRRQSSPFRWEEFFGKDIAMNGKSQRGSHLEMKWRFIVPAGQPNLSARKC